MKHPGKVVQVLTTEDSGLCAQEAGSRLTLLCSNAVASLTGYVPLEDAKISHCYFISILEAYILGNSKIPENMDFTKLNKRQD